MVFAWWRSPCFSRGRCPAGPQSPADLEDVLEEQRKGKSLMSRWLDQLESYYDKRFGEDWKKDDPEFWGKFPYWY